MEILLNRSQLHFRINSHVNSTVSEGVVYAPPCVLLNAMKHCRTDICCVL